MLNRDSTTKITKHSALILPACLSCGLGSPLMTFLDAKARGHDVPRAVRWSFRWWISLTSSNGICLLRATSGQRDRNGYILNPAVI